MFSTEKPLPKKLYLLGIIVIFVAVYAPDFLPIRGVAGYLVVYGIPVVVTGLIFGREILRRAAKNNNAATKYGLGFYGALTVLGLLVSVAALAILLYFNSQASQILERPNPVLQGLSPNGAWIMVAVSFLVIGPAEEFLFRGFTYGGLLSITKGKHWLPLAILSAVLFAAVHGYYATTYEAASIIPFITITTFAFAMCATYYYSGGNILVPALIHGAYDATGFLTIAINTEVGLVARNALMFVGIAFACYLLLKKLIMKPSPQSPQPMLSEVPPPPPPSVQSF
jgi:membrane protease YdiL (CAAX protease family)